MKSIRVSKSNLHKSLVFLRGLIDTKSSGVYSAVLLENKKRCLAITGVNSNLSTEIIIASESDEYMRFCVKGDLLASLIDSMDCEIIVLGIDSSDKLHIVGKNVAAELGIESGFPRTFDPSNLTGQEIIDNFDLRTFAGLLSRYSKLVYQGPFESISSNVFVSQNEIFACDQGRFAFEPFRFPVNLCIPKLAVAAIRGFAELLPYVSITIFNVSDSERIVCFHNDSGKLYFQTYDMDYVIGLSDMPLSGKYMLVKFPADEIVRISKDDLIIGLKRSMVVADQKNPECMFIEKDGEVKIISNNKTAATMTQTVGKARTPLKVSINPSNLLKLLNDVPSDSVIIKWGGEDSPLHFVMSDTTLIYAILSDPN